MGNGCKNVTVAIHCNPKVEWQAKRADCFADGLTALGIDNYCTSSRSRVEDIAILFGTTFWRDIEADGEYLLVDRASIGDPEYVQLVWNGHGRRGDHMVPDGINATRWKALCVELEQPLPYYQDIVLCGQTETYSPKFAQIEDWYATVKDATHFRPHPAGNNPTGLPVKKDWCASFHVLNSSVGIEAVIRGCHVVIHDEGCMAFGITDREQWATWLAWTQWRWNEIRAGAPIKHLFEAIL